MKHLKRLEEEVSPTVQLGKKRILHLSKFHGARALLVIISHLIDSSAYGIAPHQPGIVGLQAPT